MTRDAIINTLMLLGYSPAYNCLQGERLSYVFLYALQGDKAQGLINVLEPRHEGKHDRVNMEEVSLKDCPNIQPVVWETFPYWVLVRGLKLAAS